MVRSTGTKMWVWGAVAALTIGMVGFGGPATAAQPAPSNAPAATAAAVVDHDDVTITFTINRAKNQVGDVTCTLDDLPVENCDANPTSTKKLTTYTHKLNDQPDDDPTFRVTFNLTDGATASATTEFTVVAAALRQACVDWTGGVVTPNPDASRLWTCGSDTPYDGPQPGSEGGNNDLYWSGLAHLLPFCPSGNLHGDLFALPDNNMITLAAFTCHR